MAAASTPRTAREKFQRIWQIGRDPGGMVAKECADCEIGAAAFTYTKPSRETRSIKRPSALPYYFPSNGTGGTR